MRKIFAAVSLLSIGPLSFGASALGCSVDDGTDADPGANLFDGQDLRKCNGGRRRCDGGADTSTVLVVNDQNTVELRKIEVARTVGTKVVIAQGLQPGERILVEGSQKAPPGSVVKPVPFVAPVASENQPPAN